MGLSSTPNNGKSRARSDERDELFRWLCQGSSPSIIGYVGETCFHALDAVANAIVVGTGDAQAPLDAVYLVDYTLYYEVTKTLTFPMATASMGLASPYTDLAQCGLFA